MNTLVEPNLQDAIRASHGNPAKMLHNLNLSSTVGLGKERFIHSLLDACVIVLFCEKHLYEDK